MRSRNRRCSLSSIEWRRGPERGGTFIQDAPLLGPLPTPASRGEEEKEGSKMWVRRRIRANEIFGIERGNGRAG